MKTNVGHLDEGAGVTGLIKTVLCLQHRQIPPSLHFSTPNPELAYETSPFRVADALMDFARCMRERSAARRGELVRHRRHQRACDPGRGAAAP